MRIGLIARQPGGPLTSSAWIRLLHPLQRLERQGVCELQTLPPMADCGNPVVLPASLDRLIVQRSACPGLPQAEALVAACRRRGIPLVLDLDDALFALPDTHPEQERYAPALPALDHLLAEADLRVFSTAALGRLCRQRAIEQGYSRGPETVVSNGLDLELWGDCRGFPPRRDAKPLRLLYVGSETHQADLDLVLPELDRLASRQPGSFRLTLVGGALSLAPRPWLQVREVPRSCRRYPRFVRWLRGLPRHDLGLAPLVSNPFNAAKSNLKLLDYAALGLGCLCSSGEAYAAEIAAGLAIAATPGQWKQRLRWATTHRRCLRRLAKTARQELLSGHNSGVMATAWQNILENPGVISR